MASLPDGSQPPTPIPSASILILAGAPSVEVVMVRRPPGGMFGGLWVFPGGRLDDDDGPLAEGDIAWRRAAAREAMEEVGLEVPADGLVFLSRWITPSFAPRRFDTRFYVCQFEGRPPLRPRAGEVEEALFVTAAQALAAFTDGDWNLILPTLTHLRWLKRFLTAEDAIAEALAHSRDDPVEPRLAEDGSWMAGELPVL